MILKVRAVTRNWLKSDLKKTVDCRIEFTIDSDKDSLNAEVADRIRESERNVSFQLMMDTVNNGGAETVSGCALNSLIRTWMLEKYGCPKLVDLFTDNAAVPYVEFEWNGWIMFGLNGILAFNDRPWRKLNKKTADKVSRNSTEYEIGKTELTGSFGRPIVFGEPYSKFYIDGTLKREFRT